MTKSISEMLKQSLPQLPLDVTGRITDQPEVETDRHGGATTLLPGETEAGSAGRNPAEG
jgi:hypothetical protein